MQINVKENMY